MRRLRCGRLLLVLRISRLVLFVLRLVVLDEPVQMHLTLVEQLPIRHLQTLLSQLARKLFDLVVLFLGHQLACWVPSLGSSTNPEGVDGGGCELGWTSPCLGAGGGAVSSSLMRPPRPAADPDPTRHPSITRSAPPGTPGTCPATLDHSPAGASSIGCCRNPRSPCAPIRSSLSLLLVRAHVWHVLNRCLPHRRKSHYRSIRYPCPRR